MNAAPPAPHRGADPAAAGSPPTHIVLVEDDAAIRRFVRMALEAAGHTVHEAATRERGLIEAGTRKPDLLILDLGLPDGDGCELIRDLRGWSSMQVIVLSARTSEDDKVAALDAGADDYLSKPFSGLALRAVLLKWLPAGRPQAPLPNVAAAAPSLPGEAAAGAPAASATPHADAPTFDAHALDEVRSMDEDGSLLESLLHLFFDDGQRLLDAMQAAHDRGDVPGLVFAAHKLASSGATVGARRFSLQTRAVENEARQSERLCPAATLHSLRHEFEQASTQIEQATGVTRRSIPREIA